MTKTKIEWAEFPTGNRIITKNGYVIIFCPDHPFAKPNGYIFEHRFIIEKSLKRFLRTNEHIHHINGNKSDNNVENLQIISPNDHARLHQQMESQDAIDKRIKDLVSNAKARAKPRTVILCKCGCGIALITPDSKGRDRLYIKGHNQKGKKWSWGNG